MPRHWTPRSTSDKTLNSFARTLLQTIDDTQLMQSTTHSIYSGESQSTIEHFHPYGFTMVPQPAKDGQGAESIMAFLGGGREHGVAIVTADRRYRLQNLKSGEVALHDDQTQQLHIARDGTYHSVPNDKKHTSRIMRKQDSVKGKQQGGAGGLGGAGAGGGQNDQLGQQAWQPKTPYAHHSIDKDTRTVQHPGKIAHQVTDTNDQSTVVHESFLDQIKGILHSVQKGLHSITISPQGGIVHSVQNALHSITLLNGINLKSGGSISAIATQAISQVAPNINLKGASSVTGTLGVSGLLSGLGGATFGASSFTIDAAGDLSASSFTSGVITPETGDILYRGAISWRAINPGISGYVLTTQGAGNPPIWTAGGGGGGGGASNYLGAYTVASLPSGDPQWSTATAVDGIAVGDASSTEHGCPVYFNGVWRTFSSDAPVAAGSGPGGGGAGVFGGTSTNSVKAFGCIGDGVADDTVNFQAAITGCGGDLYINPGTYKITSPLTVAASIYLHGAAGLSIIQAGSGLAEALNVTTPDPVIFEKFSILGVSGAGTALIYVTPSGTYNGSSTFRDLALTYGGSGLYLGNAAFWTVDRCYCYQQNGNGIYVANTTNVDYGDSSITNCIISYPGASCIYQASSGGLRVQNNKLIGGVYAYQLNLAGAGNTSDLIFVGNSIENQTASGGTVALIGYAADLTHFSNALVIGNQTNMPTATWNGLPAYPNSVYSPNVSP